MGCILSCKKGKTEEEYIREIFDGLDIDGTQDLDAEEINLIWNRVKQNKLELLQNELSTFIANKNQEIADTRDLNADSMLKNGKSVSLEQFKPIIKSLNLNHDELHNLWINTKQNEINNIQKLLDEA